MLTSAQNTIIRSWIIANNSSIFDQSSVNLLNAEASPLYRVWRSSVNKHDVIELPDVDSVGATTTFALGGGTGSYIDRSQGERDGWRELWNTTESAKPYLANTRVTIFDIFSGTAALAQQNRRHCWARGLKPALLWHKLLAVATVGGPVHTAANGNNPAGQTGARGSWTNPDTLAVGTMGEILDGLITLEQVIGSESV